MTTREVNVEAALRDPASVFATPEEVASHPKLTRAQKIEILRPRSSATLRWWT